MKKVYANILILFMIISFTGCTPRDDGVTRDVVFTYVENNFQKLEAFPYEEMLSNAQNRTEFIKNTLGDNTIVQNVYSYNENIIEFNCGGSGLVTGSTYTGFYFSKNDTPFALDFDGVTLEEIDSGVFQWKNEDGSHMIHTEKILDCWYYYVEEYY